MRRKFASPEGFDKFLDRLGPAREHAGNRYVELHQKLTRFFAWNRCPFPEDQADTVIDRVVRRLDEGEDVLNLNSYVLGIARMVLREAHAAAARQPQAAALRMESAPAEDAAEFACLDSCLGKLPAESRNLIMEYYSAEPGKRIDVRKNLAERLGFSANTLRNRALRLRAKLEHCVDTCTKGRSGVE